MRNVVDRDIAFRPLDPAEIGAIDAALVRQRFLAQTTFRAKATHIPRQVALREFVLLPEETDEDDEQARELADMGAAHQKNPPPLAGTGDPNE